MYGRLSDFDNIFILSMKMQRESCFRIDSKQQQKLFKMVFFHACLIKQMQTQFGLLKNNVFAWLIRDTVLTNFYVNGLKKKSRFFEI